MRNSNMAPKATDTPPIAIGQSARRPPGYIPTGAKVGCLPPLYVVAGMAPAGKEVASVGDAAVSVAPAAPSLAFACSFIRSPFSFSLGVDYTRPPRPGPTGYLTANGRSEEPEQQEHRVYAADKHPKNDFHVYQ
jgi:hypothetical protein